MWTIQKKEKESDLLANGRQVYEENRDNVEMLRKGMVTTYTVNGAKILAAVEASNGVVHVIDKVLSST